MKNIKISKKAPGAAASAALLALLVAFSFALNMLDAPKTFFVGEMTLCLTDEFTATKAEGFFAAAFESADTRVLVMRESCAPGSGLSGKTLAEYGAFVADSRGVAGAGLLHEDELRYFTYENSAVFLFASDQAFFHVEFISRSGDISLHIDEFSDLAKRISIHG